MWGCGPSLRAVPDRSVRAPRSSGACQCHARVSLNVRVGSQEGRRRAQWRIVSTAVNAEQLLRYVGRAFNNSWATRDALVREANNQWAPAAVIELLVAVPDRYYRNFDDLLVVVADRNGGLQ